MSEEPMRYIPAVARQLVQGRRSVTSRVIEDRACGVTIALSGNGSAHVAWRDGTSDSELPNRSCWVDARLLAIGRWIPMRQDDKTDAEPTIYVVCRATALVVAASIKADVLEALKGLP
jgi:hypothetical protein